jgi:hypothetical protein
MPLETPENFQEILKDFVEKHGTDKAKGLSELLALVKKAKERRASAAPEEKKPDTDCPEDVEDCSDIVSPCCKVPVSTVFGTLPLKVSCKQCGKEHLLGALMRDLLRKPKTPAPV